MIKTLIACSAVILLFVLSTGCTTEDETISMKVSGLQTIEPSTDDDGYIGILNLTFFNDHSGALIIDKSNIELIGRNINSSGTKPKLEVIGISISGNESESFKKGEKRTISIEHVLFENITLDEITYRYKDFTIVLDNKDIKKKSREEIVVRPAFYKTNYFLITMVFVIGIATVLLIMGRGEKAPTPGKNLCRFCLEDLADKKGSDKLYCNKWLTRTKRCGEGPFCSKRCLEYHWEDVNHEN